MEKELEKRISDLMAQSQQIISELTENNNKLAKKNKDMKVYEGICEKKDTYNMREAVKLISFRTAKNKTLGSTTCMRILREVKVLMTSPKNQPYQKHIDSGNYSYKIVENNGYSHPMPLVTAKGLKHLNKVIERYYSE